MRKGSVGCLPIDPFFWGGEPRRFSMAVRSMTPLALATLFFDSEVGQLKTISITVWFSYRPDRGNRNGDCSDLGDGED